MSTALGDGVLFAGGCIPLYALSDPGGGGTGSKSPPPPEGVKLNWIILNYFHKCSVLFELFKIF